MSSFLSRMFRRPPHITTVPQWIVWRTKRNARKVTSLVRRRVSTVWFAIRPVAHPVACPGVTLSVHRDRSDIITDSLVRTGSWEPVETELMLRLLRPGMTMVDIGANLGYMTVLGSRQVGPDGLVIAFEPVASNFVLLERNVTRNRCHNVQSHQVAVGAEPGASLTMFLATENLGDHRAFPDANEPRRKSYRVPSTTVDSVVAGRPVDFIKMDIQGAEGHALVGMAETLQQNTDLVLLFEFWPYGLRRAGTSPRDLLNRLIGLGFSLRLVAKSLDSHAGEGELTSSTTPESVLADTAGERFDQTMNLLAVRGSKAAQRY